MLKDGSESGFRPKTYSFLTNKLDRLMAADVVGEDAGRSEAEFCLDDDTTLRVERVRFSGGWATPHRVPEFTLELVGDEASNPVTITAGTEIDDQLDQVVLRAARQLVDPNFDQ